MNKIETIDKRQFSFAGTEPYLKVDGTLIFLKLWVSSCVVCGNKFIVKTPLKVIDLSGSSSFNRIHCDEHKMTKEEAAKKWSAAGVAAKSAKRLESNK